MTATGSRALCPWMAVAEAELGVREIAGPRALERILGYWRICGDTKQSSDEVPWCAIFVGACLIMAGYRSSGSAMARSYLKYGRELPGPEVGAIGISTRGKPPSGHVFFIAGFTATHVLALGGNQGDAVSTIWIERKSIIGYRMPSTLDRIRTEAVDAEIIHPEPEPPAPDTSPAPETAAPPAEANAPAEPTPPAAPAFPKLKDAKESWTVTGLLLSGLGAVLGYLHDAASLAISLAADALGVVNELGPVKALVASAGLTMPRLAISLTVAGITLAAYRRIFKDTKPR